MVFNRPAVLRIFHPRTLLLAFIVCQWSASTLSYEPVAKGDRVLAVKVNLGQSDDFDRALKESLAVGSETQVIPLDWNQIETSPGQFAPAVNFLAIANGYYPAIKMPVHLSLRPVHTNQMVVPDDLKNKPINHPETIRRFINLLDWVAIQIPRLELVSLNIGSEVDIYLWGDAIRWRQWIDFYSKVSTYARKKFPGTLISCETTFYAFVGSDLSRLQKLHAFSDAIGVSYYPMELGLQAVRPPESVLQDFTQVTEAISSKPVIFYQIGYPSSPELGSSPQRQADFIRQAFQAWDQHASRILMLNFQWMHETTSAGLDYYASYYQLDAPEFRYFLGSLGFKSWSGKAKPAWELLKDEAARRGFGRN